jgi:hypothetical protein
MASLKTMIQRQHLPQRGILAMPWLFRVNRVTVAMSASCPVHPQHQTFV